MSAAQEKGAQEKKSSKTLREILTQAAIALSLALLVIILTQGFLFNSPLKNLENATLDMRFQYRGPRPVPQESLKVVIVDITEDAIKALPHRYPWPHSYYARVARNLYRAGVLGVGYDIIFDQPDAEDLKNDSEMVDAIRSTHIVAVAGKTAISNGEYSIKEKDYASIFYAADSSLGIAYVPGDDEGVYRRYQPMTWDADAGKFVPELSFAVLDKYFHQPPSYTAKDGDNDFTYMDRKIPKADPSTMYVNYYGPDHTFKHISFADIIDDHEFKTKDELSSGADIDMFDDPDIGYLSNGFFKGKVVLIGSTMPEDKDMFSVPIGQGRRAGDNLMYGVEIHANIIQNVIDNNFLRREPKWVDILSIIGLSLLTFMGIIKIRALKIKYHSINEIMGAFAVIGGIGLISFGSAKAFTHYNYVMIVTSPILSIALGYIAAIAYTFLAERKQKAMIKGMFSQYLNPAVVNQLVDNPDKLRLGGERKVLTVFFSDIAGFTSLSEKSTPEGLVALLNEYLTAMTKIIFDFGGTLDKYEGDAIMAFWGAPIDQEDHAIRACRASLAMQKELVNIRERWKAAGKPEIAVRIGLNSGEMLVGNMGGQERFDYTVIGDNVNLASRLEGANKQYKSHIMLGQTTHKLVADQVIARELDMLIVVGKTEPITVWELLGMKEDGIPEQLQKFFDCYHEGLRLHRLKQWDAAIECLETSLKYKPGDYPAQMYIERSRLYQMSPPPDDWNGVFVLKSK